MLGGITENLFGGLLEDVLDWRRARHLDDLDWITRNRLKLKQRKKEFARIAGEAKRDQKNPRRVLLWGPTGWERGALEHMLALALRLRGHEVLEVSCAGGFPACSMETVLSPRPDCQSCTERAARMRGVFPGADDSKSANEYLKPEDFSAAEAEIAALAPSDFPGHVHEGIEVGRIVARDIPQYFARHVRLDDPAIEADARRTLVATLLYLKAALRAHREFRPDVGVVTAGMTTAYAPFYEVCRQAGTTVIGWDESYEKDSFSFSYNRVEELFDLDPAWRVTRHEPLKPEEDAFVQGYLEKMARGRLGYNFFYPAPIRELEPIRRELGLEAGAQRVVLLTNVSWDTALSGKDLAFSSMEEWILSTVAAIIPARGIELILRFHPYDRNSTVTGPALLRERFPNLPRHIKIVEPQEQIQSHALADLADVIGVYNTSMGMELAIRGRCVVACGRPHYMGKGFTRDILKKEDWLEMITDPARFPPPRIPAEAVNLAKKYFHLLVGRSEAAFPEFRQPTRFSFELDPEEFLPGRGNRWDRLCDAVAYGGPLLDISPVRLKAE